MWCKRSIDYTKKTKKTYALDLLPSCVFTQCIDILTPMLTNIINASITQLHNYTSLNEIGHRTSIIKEIILMLTHYQIIDLLVSDVKEVSKCLEKVIGQQLFEHASDMTELYQSAYKSTHFTETAFIAM